MKQPLLWVFIIAVIVLGYNGIGFLEKASKDTVYSVNGAPVVVQAEARTPTLIAGIACLSIATGLLIFAVKTFRKPEGS